MDPGLECAIGVAGKEYALFPFGVKNFESENVLVIRGLPPLTDEGDPMDRMAAFSLSEEEFLNLKLSLGRRFFIDDLSLRMVELEDLSNPATIGLFIGEKFTLLGVGRMLICTESSGEH